MTTVLVVHPGAELYGADRMMLESVEGFVERGWRVVVSLPTSGPLVGAIESRGVEVRPCDTPVLRKAFLGPRGLLQLAGISLRALVPGLKLLRSVRPDVVYVSTLTLPMWIVLARCLRIPVVCHVHEAESKASAIVRKGLAAPLLLARQIAVNSRFSAGVLTDAWPRLAPRCTVVYNGVAGPPAPTAPRTALEPPIRLLYLGRLSERKGVPDAVDVLAVLESRGLVAQLDVVGDVFPGYEWVVDDLRRRANAAGTDSRVHLHGFDADIWPHLAHADILLVPSRLDEPFGNVAIEGALAARPVIVSGTSGLVEAIDGFEAASTVPPGNPTALADAIGTVVGRWSEFRAGALADAAQASDRFSLERYRSGIADVVSAATT
ncbi:MAG: glycosyltransferase family 4 protein [Acidimicrobiia bacterium]